MPQKNLKWIVIGVILVAIGFWWGGTYNSLVKKENLIRAVYEDMQNVHGVAYKSMKAQGLAVQKYGKMVEQAMEVAIQARYGEDGSKAAMQWIQEHNPNIDPVIMAKLQQAIEAGFNEFKAVQRAKIDVARTFRDEMETFPGSLVAGFHGFPRHPDTEQMMSQIISSSETKVDFMTGELSDPDLFGDAK